MQMIVRFFATAARKRIFGCFQLHNYTGEPLCERVVDVARHSIAFFEHRSSLISVNVFANYRARRKKQLLDGWVLFPKQPILHEWMLWIRRDQFSALRH